VRAIIAFLGLFFILSCATTKKAPPLGPKQGELSHLRSILSLEEAQLRKKQLSNVSYEQYFELHKGNTFSGKTTLTFDFIPVGDFLRVDLMTLDLTSVEMDGEPVAYKADGGAVYIPVSSIPPGTHRLTIAYSKTYSKTGSGLYRFEDPKDGRIYLYTDLEPFDANQVFPCFDQPDIKAKYTMTVDAPRNWKVITHSHHTKLKNISRTHRRWTFPTSEKFSTYIWSLHAGPYYKWTDRAGDIELGLYARQSLAKHVRPKHWFSDTKAGFKFFTEYFDYPYPYGKKYDQILAPDFNAGAMENVAAVTFSEWFVAKGPKSERLRFSLRNVILHEMAHMWFGNLVTMKWWDDLWLNESFATYMANLAAYDITQNIKHWRSFDSRQKFRTYVKDQLRTTHPIQADIPDTQAASANFDAITYGKGASFLKMLVFYIGEEQFKQGMREYFKLHAERNTVLQDFVNALSKSTGQDLAPWFKTWLETSGLNNIVAEWTCSPENKIDGFNIKQTAPKENPVLRRQKTRIGLYQKVDSQVRLTETHDVIFEGSKTKVASLYGKDCPDFVFPNYEEMAYAEVELDQKSLDVALKGLDQFSDIRIREQISNSLWEMVRDGNLSAYQYTKLAMKQIQVETDPEILMALLTHLHGYYSLSHSVARYFPKSTEQEKKAYQDFIASLESLIWKKLQSAPGGSELQKKLIYSLNASAETEIGLKNVKSILDNPSQLPGLKLASNEKWHAIRTLCSANYGNPMKLANAELERENSHDSKLGVLSCRARIPNSDTKKELYAKLLDPANEDPMINKKMILWNLYDRTQQKLWMDLSKNFVEDVKVRAAKLQPSLVDHLGDLAPDGCLESNREKVQGLLEDQVNLTPKLKKSLIEYIQYGEICETVRDDLKKQIRRKNSLIEITQNTGRF
tara:strand:+ start:2188 stop:4914 length:2727 start_codon:yes stop_codon:yes gene_type:complete